ncbi:hypothetical protein FH008_04690 [Listeria monocytogenes]|nr:hypothetical protein [Listeria monocytogenes]
MGRPKLMDKPQFVSHVHGVWSIEDLANASSKCKSWWYKHIYDFPEVKAFSNWEIKTEREAWAFDAVKANNWLIKKFVYKEV